METESFAFHFLLHDCLWIDLIIIARLHSNNKDEFDSERENSHDQPVTQPVDVGQDGSWLTP